MNQNPTPHPPHTMSSDRSPAELEAVFKAIARTAAIAAGTGSPALTPTTLLHMDDEHFVVLSGPGEQPETVHRLDLGAVRIASTFFHHDPPTSLEIERAIDFAEDEIMRLGRPGTVGTPLWSTAPALQAWCAVSGPNLTIERVEQWFQRLASASLGQLGAWQGLPTGRQAAATLLVLREFLHHRGHASVSIVEPPTTPAQ